MLLFAVLPIQEAKVLGRRKAKRSYIMMNVSKSKVVSGKTWPGFLIFTRETGGGKVRFYDKEEGHRISRIARNGDV